MHWTSLRQGPRGELRHPQCCTQTHPLLLLKFCTKACMTGTPCLSRDAELLYQARYGKQDKMTKEQYAALKRKVGGQSDQQRQLPLLGPPLLRIPASAHAHCV